MCVCEEEWLVAAGWLISVGRVEVENEVEHMFIRAM